MNFYLLLAEHRSAFMHLGDKFRRGGSDISLESVAIVIGVIAAVGGAIWLLSFLVQRELKPHYNPRSLFRALCRAHHLERAQQRLLKSLAERRGLAHPAELFVEPQFLSEAADDATLRDRRGELLDLRKRLFGA